jgi:hypothetical protein
VTGGEVGHLVTCSFGHFNALPNEVAHLAIYSFGHF